MSDNSQVIDLGRVRAERQQSEARPLDLPKSQQFDDLIDVIDLLDIDPSDTVNISAETFRDLVIEYPDFASLVGEQQAYVGAQGIYVKIQARLIRQYRDRMLVDEVLSNA